METLFVRAAAAGRSHKVEPPEDAEGLGEGKKGKKGRGREFREWERESAPKSGLLARRQRRHRRGAGRRLLKTGSHRKTK